MRRLLAGLRRPLKGFRQGEAVRQAAEPVVGQVGRRAVDVGRTPAGDQVIEIDGTEVETEARHARPIGDAQVA